MNELIHDSVTASAMAEPKGPAPKLNLIANLLEVFHENDINYCHWKSNEHLDASMTGDTDLDVLFDEKQKEQLLVLLDELGFKKFDSIKEKQYKDIEDFIGLDFQSCKVVHLHAHFRLTMGEAYLKGYQLDLEEKILNSRVFDETFGIYCTNPAFELILLYFREALKIRNRDILMMNLLNKTNYYGNILNEYHWLKQRCTNQDIEAILKTLFVDYRPIYDLVINKFNRRELLKLAALLKKEFKNHRLYSPTKALMLRWYREVSVKLYRKSSRLLNRPIISQRINPRGGIIVAVIGADGSGKSTVIANLEATFRKKLDVYRIYMGRGDGKISWARKMLLGLKKMVVAPQSKKQIQDGKPKNQSVQSAATKKKRLIATIYKCMEALIVANEKRKNLKRMRAAKKKGMLVICDRFPQNQVMGYNDGPLLYFLAASPNFVFRAISKLEARVYAQAEHNPPDVLFKLIADAKVVEARKPGETSLEMLEAKIAGVRKLRFADTCNVVTVDAAQPLKMVLSTINKKIWDAYL